MNTILKTGIIGIISAYSLMNLYTLHSKSSEQKKNELRNTSKNTRHSIPTNTTPPLVYVSSSNHLLLYNEQNEIDNLIVNAKLGDIEAILTLGKLYSQGSTKNIEKSIHWYNKAATLGNSDALVELGIIHERPNDPIATKKAIDYYKKAIKLDNGYAMTRLAMLYGIGHFTEEGTYIKDSKLAMDLLNKGALTMDSRSLYMIAQQYEVNYLFPDTINIPKALYYYEQIITHDETFSQEKVNAYQNAAFMYIYNKKDGVKQNMAKGMKYLKIAAAKRNVSALTTLAEIYEYGRLKSLDEVYGIEEITTINYSKAFYYHNKAALEEHQDSMSTVALWYQNGKGTQKDFTKALEWYQKLAQLDDKRGFYGLGVAYQYGYGVEKNNIIALEYYKKAAAIQEENHVCLTGVRKQKIYLEQLQAMHAIGQLYYRGDDNVEKNQEIAKKWLKKAADLNYFPSQFLLFKINKKASKEK